MARPSRHAFAPCRSGLRSDFDKAAIPLFRGSGMDSVRLILVSPKFAGNVGSCARVAANFDVTDFRVVNPRCDIFDKQSKLLATGPSAENLESVKLCATLAEALEGASAAVAFTRRVGEMSPDSVAFRDLPAWVGERSLKGGVTALVFGREDFCLFRDEALLCTHLVTIPASTRMPTMNLSHSVAAVLSAIYAADHDPAVMPVKGDAAPLQEFEELVDHWRQTMLDAGMDSMHNLDITVKRIRRVLQKARMEHNEVTMLRGFLARLQNALGTRKRVGGNAAKFGSVGTGPDQK